MIRTQIQLPDELYARAKAYSVAKEISLAEMTRRGLELFFAQYPAEPIPEDEWTFPTVNGGGILVPLESLKDILSDEETFRSLPHDDQH